jgi:predicted extracellular nuclease
MREQENLRPTVNGQSGFAVLVLAVALLPFSSETAEAAVGICGGAATLIHDIQGSGSVSPDVGNIREIEGVVVGGFQGSSKLNGFFLQEESGDVDADSATSEGIFVFDNNFGTDVVAGHVVRVRGLVSEFHGLTELTNVEAVLNCNTIGTVTPAPLTLPLTTTNDLEAVEGMAVYSPQTLYITELFNFGRFGEITLSTARQFQPTAVVAPGPPAQAGAAANILNRITLDDGSTRQNPDPAIQPNGSDFSLSNLFRSGDSVEDITGVMDYRFDRYRIQPTQGAKVRPLNPRAALPDPVEGSLTVASFNLQNYFTTLDTGESTCGPTNQDCRGANNLEEFTRQRAKIIDAIVTMDADIVALMEIENHPTDAALADLVSGLNSAASAGTYAVIDSGVIGGDAIKVGLIYQPASVAPDGAFAVLDSSVDPSFNDGLNRPALAQTFAQNGTGAKFTAVLNHFKSKGSACNHLDDPDPDLGDGQGNCNLTRTAAAMAVAAWLATDPTGSEDADFLILGDLNAYDKEDPITALNERGYTDLLSQYLGEFAYSFVFDGQLGHLDHALANAALLEQVTGVTVWHINADEPNLIDYRTDFKRPTQQALYAPDAYRSSDHDPVLIGLDLIGDSDSSDVVDSMDLCPDSEVRETTKDCQTEEKET